MTTKAAFDAEQWDQIATAPALAAASVILAERGGTLRESVSMARAFREAARGERTELLRELLASPPSLDREAVGGRDELVDRAERVLRDDVALLESRATPEEVADYKAFVLDLAETVARSHKEGGFLGFGGEPVSDRERAVLDQLAATLGMGEAAA